jgi:hypothetical protein
MLVLFDLFVNSVRPVIGLYFAEPVPRVGLPALMSARSCWASMTLAGVRVLIDLRVDLKALGLLLVRAQSPEQ